MSQEEMLPEEEFMDEEDLPSTENTRNPGIFRTTWTDTTDTINTPAWGQLFGTTATANTNAENIRIYPTNTNTFYHPDANDQTQFRVQEAYVDGYKEQYMDFLSNFILNGIDGHVTSDAENGETIRERVITYMQDVLRPLENRNIISNGYRTDVEMERDTDDTMDISLDCCITLSFAQEEQTYIFRRRIMLNI